LWIAKQFSRELGGDLMLCNKRGPGAKFVAKLPLPGAY
jgi:signal transduction histidine kinase